MNGFIIVDKPKGLTSNDVCYKLRKKLHVDKCGHSGTLDPNTTGLLVVAVGQATKLMKLINEHDKVYNATISFGFDSKTLDFGGEITNDIEMNFTMDELKKALDVLKNQKSQVPPMVSAIKINGQKMYDLARKGIEVDLKPRDVIIHDFEILSELRNVDNHLEFDIRLHVSKGFYVRSFARDFGKLLGGCAIMKELRREKSGDFDIKDAVLFDEIDSSSIKTIEEVFDLDCVEVNDYIARLVMNGVELDERQTSITKPFYVVNNGKKIAIYEPKEDNKYSVVLIFR
ncbi:MAG: tRNA pseudouridine(55) synthase TruB [Acholeplasmatales bacterium]|nr:tRNA pseudouridine(55) synthase TruB [Acholeplasmatales bacterium]